MMKKYIPALGTILLSLCLVVGSSWLRSVTSPLPQESIAEQGTHLSHSRSGKWPTLEKKFLTEHPVCEVCGTKKGLQVHHVKPFHLDPSLELDEGNLIVLCGPEGHNCHFCLGHLFNYKRENIHIRELATLIRRYVQEAEKE